MVMSTDMKQHFSAVSLFNTRFPAAAATGSRERILQIGSSSARPSLDEAQAASGISRDVNRLRLDCAMGSNGSSNGSNSGGGRRTPDANAAGRNSSGGGRASPHFDEEMRSLALQVRLSVFLTVQLLLIPVQLPLISQVP